MLKRIAGPNNPTNSNTSLFRTLETFEDALPANPVTDSNALVVIPAANPAAGDLEMGADAGIFGWKYDVVSGKFIANDNRNDSAGNPYEEY